MIFLLFLHGFGGRIKIEEIKPTLLFTIKDNFTQITFADISDSLCALLDPIDSKCYIYRGGKRISSFGKEGNAPGEFKLMHAGGIKISPDRKIYVYDPGNFRVQVFTESGELLKTIPISVVASDFDVDKNFLYFVPVMGDKELVITDFSGKIVKEIKGRNINFLVEEFPYPVKMLEEGDKNVYYGFLDEKRIKVFSKKEMSIKKSITLDIEPIPIDNKTRKKMEKKAPQLKGRIRKFQFPWSGLMYDSAKHSIWVLITTGEKNYPVLDVFNDNGKHIKRVKIKTLKAHPIAINDGKMISFLPDSGWVMVYDISMSY